MEAKFSQKVKTVITNSRNEAVKLGSDYIGLEHLVLGIIREKECTAVKLLTYLGVDNDELKKKIEFSIFNKKNKDEVFDNKDIPLLKQAERVLKITYLEAKLFKSEQIGTEHLLLAILRDQNSSVTKIFNQYSVNYENVKELLNKTSVIEEDNQIEFQDSFDDTADDEPEDFDTSSSKKSKKFSGNKSKTPVLDNFGRDLTKASEEGRLDPIVGREKELERIAQILSRRKKNNPMLIGEPGVGKSAIAEGLATKIIERKVSRALFNKRIFTLDLASIVAGTKYRGQFEERMKAVINELTKNPDIILFIDEIHTIVGAGNASGSLDASNMFKPALARGEIQCIGATTLNDYRQHIEKDGALERRFQKIIVEPTNPEETIEILNNIKEKYEDHHLVKYTDEAINACVTLTNRYMSERYLPDKAIDALDEAGSRIHIKNIHVPTSIIKIEKEIDETKSEKIKSINCQKFEEAAKLRDIERNLQSNLEKEKKKWEEESQIHREIVTEENVGEVVAMMTGIPVQRIAQNESNRLIKMEDVLKSSVIGQNNAVKKVVKAIRRNRAGLKDPSKPIGSFIFLGPTGVGKTYLAKILSEYLFDSTDSLIRIDMSEFMEKFAVSRLIGAPPGYVGYEEGGQLTEKVRRKPYSIILLDEIEKAHPDVFHILLQVLDDGVLTDSFGRKVDFKNTIIIMTSNIGSRQLKDFGYGIGFDTNARKAGSDDYAKGVIENSLKKTFAPEFLNRIDDVVIFDSLKIEDIKEIINIELKELILRIKSLGYEFSINDKAKNYIVEKGWDEKFGARPLKRAIQKYIEDPLAEELIKNKFKKGDTIIVDADIKNNKTIISKKEAIKKLKK